jgi:hypothetical protein
MSNSAFRRLRVVIPGAAIVVALTGSATAAATPTYSAGRTSVKSATGTSAQTVAARCRKNEESSYDYLHEDEQILYPHGSYCYVSDEDAVCQHIGDLVLGPTDGDDHRTFRLTLRQWSASDE